MAWLTVLVVVTLALGGTQASHHESQKFRFIHQQDLNIRRQQFLNEIKDVVQMDQPRPIRLSKMSWKNCGSPSAPVMINNLTISPDPLRVPGDLNLSASVSIKDDLTAPLKAVLLMKKSLFGEWVRIPCYKGKVGSCTYDDVCALMHPKDPCPDPLPKYKIPCHCPFAKGSYYLPYSSFKLKSPGHIPPGIVNGAYTIQVNLSKNGKDMGCFFLQMNLHF